MRLLVLASMMVLQASIVPANLPRDISADDFNQLFQQLNSNLFSQREAAQKRLTDLATSAQLTGAQLQTIQGAIGGGNLEVGRRATEIFGAFVESLPSYQNLVKAAQVQLTRPVLFNPTIVDDNTTQIGKFRFGEATGSFFSPGTTSYRAFTSLSDSWLPVQKALVVGNIAEARQALRNFRTTTNMLTDVEIVNLDIEDAGGRALRRNDLLARIDAAIQELVSFQFDLLNGGARDDSGLPVPTPTRNAGLVPLGQSLALNLGLIVAPGSVALFGPDGQSARSLPPPGFEFVGHIFDLQAQDGLLIGGSIGIDIEFGDVQLVGNPVHDPRRLQIVRIANGQDFFLPTILIDTERVSAAYSLDPSSMAGDQFGEFSLVQAVPEPATLVLTGAGLLLLLCATVLPSTKARGRWLADPRAHRGLSFSKGVMVMKIYTASGLLLAFLFASTSAHAVPLTGTNWQVQNVSNNQAPAVFLTWTNVGDPRIAGVNKGVLTVSKIYDSAHLGPVSLLFSQVTPTTPDSGGFSTFGLAFWLDEKISNGSTSPMTGLTMKLADGANESTLRQFRQILSVEQGSKLGGHPEAAHFHTIQNPPATADPWEITPNPEAGEGALELDFGEGVLAPEGGLVKGQLIRSSTIRRQFIGMEVSLVAEPGSKWRNIPAEKLLARGASRKNEL